jgi:hypothetical protein
MPQHWDAVLRPVRGSFTEDNAELFHRIVFSFLGINEQVQGLAVYRCGFLDGDNPQIQDMTPGCGYWHTHSLAPDLQGFCLTNGIVVFDEFSHGRARDLLGQLTPD